MMIKRILLVFVCLVVAYGALAGDGEVLHPWLNVQTNNFGLSMVSDTEWIGHVIDDQSRSNLPSSWRRYSGSMTLEFYDAPGRFRITFSTYDSTAHVAETILIRAYNDDDQVFYQSYRVDDSQTRSAVVEFVDSGMHRIVINGSYERIFSQNAVARGCVTTFSDIKWRPNYISVNADYGDFEVPCDWLDGNSFATDNLTCTSDYLDLAHRIGANGSAMADSYVAGLNPNDINSKLLVLITMENGYPLVSWSPKLSEAEEAKRVYTIYGKKTLEASEPWTSVEMPAQGGWRFFKVGVEMR